MKYTLLLLLSLVFIANAADGADDHKDSDADKSSTSAKTTSLPASGSSTDTAVTGEFNAT